MLVFSGRTGTALPVCPNICIVVTVYIRLVRAEIVARLRALVHDTFVSLAHVKRVAVILSKTLVTDPTFPGPSI